MGRNKLNRFEYNLQAHNIIQKGKDNFEDIAGNWNSTIFEKNQPITLEIGCGNAEYTLGIARKFPERNVIGIDIKGSRIYNGAKKSEEEGLKNTAFLRLQMHELNEKFGPGEVDEFWITFPDPRPRDRDERRRLVYSRYIKLYQEVSHPGAIVNLKTDNHGFYLYALEVCQQMNLTILNQTDDLYQSDCLDLCMGIQTTYEKQYLEKGIKINYLRFRI